jgi:hypothetical protein
LLEAMTEFAETLAWLEGMPSGWKTLRLRGREWKHGPRLLQAFEREVADARNRGRSSRVVRIRKIGTPDSRNADPEPEEGETEWKLWVERPDRIRAEFGVVDDWITAVFRGDTWWSWAPSRGARTNGGRHNVGHGRGPGWALVDAAAIPALLSLSVVDTGRFLNRETIRVRGVPQKAAAIEAPLALLRDHPLVELGMGADEYGLTVDRTTGVLLRSEASVFGQPFKIIEALDFVVDEVLSAETFALNLPAGVAYEEALPPQVRPPHRSRILRLLGR